MGHHALVFGASGILGWSIVDQILKNYPAKDVFSKVTALSNRPLSHENSLWPSPGPGTPELRIVDGIDLTKGTIEEMKDVLRERVPGIQDVTHIYYFGSGRLFVNLRRITLHPYPEQCRADEPY